MQSQRGFSLIELMVTLIVLAILITVAIPGFAGLMRNIKASALSNDVVGALQYARSEAVKRNQTVTLCSGQTVAGACGDNWTTGWLVYLPSDDSVLRVWTAPVSDAELVQTGGVAAINFTGDGRVNAATTLTANIDYCTGNEKRIIEVSAIGRVSVRRTAC